MSDFTFGGRVRRTSRLSNGADLVARGTQYESIAVAQFEPPYLEALRAGYRYVGGTQVIASGIAPVTAIPTTTATLALYNTASDGAESLVVDQIGFFLGSGTPTAGATLLLALSAGKPTAPSAASNYSSQCLSTTGKSTVARWATALTIASGSSWFQAQSTFQLAAVNVGQGDRPATPASGIIVPPGYALGIAILSGAGTTPLYSVSASWLEIPLDIE